ncbi:MAG: hypothetical protein KIT84_27485 [Labilithrix sp.]|nr:hypothetical protein [Labilithrix sp.]MCW5814801.1 hypothetical protein [Labilithrix sp.]
MSAPSPARRRIPRALFVLAIVGVVPTVASCNKKTEVVIVDAGEPPPPPPETPTELVPIEEEDAGEPDAEAAAPFKGPAVNPNVARVKACCNALAAQGNQNKNSPEGQMVLSAAAQCNAAAAHLGPNGTAPELAVMRQMLVGKTLPAVCQGL